MLYFISVLHKNDYEKQALCFAQPIVDDVEKVIDFKPQTQTELCPV